MNYQELISFGLLFATMLLWGATPLLEKIGLKEVEPLTGVLIRSASITVILFLVYIFSGRAQELTKVSLKNYALFTASGVMAGLVGMWTYFYLLRSGMTSKIVPIAASYPLITAILSIVILGEALSLQRVIGIIMTIVGIILIQQS
ncbi:MAG TPA: EamA family transporter [Syntrophorhabdaceae bacterium]|nr:EamA family transporter [Syntrophorhabdaceae bacterium]HQM82797.1 EamA family transporter [Syntrophorhabdaceae bacterium]